MRDLNNFKTKTVLLWLSPGEYYFKYMVDGREEIDQGSEVDEIQGKFWNKIKIYPLDANYNNYAHLSIETIQMIEREISQKPKADPLDIIKEISEKRQESHEENVSYEDNQTVTAIVILDNK
jgi:hypothetical protein